ncbi:septin-7-like isoform X2 [Tigriopus californicus]|uniref:septin-7-like isoform X2 n=1 Tax=Tigriopus californicus TaxID=6832 RepID=UPI0027DA3B12|nr:septin-7-like isoform X2 [Tigriopus californicus]
MLPKQKFWRKLTQSQRRSAQRDQSSVPLSIHHTHRTEQCFDSQLAATRRFINESGRIDPKGLWEPCENMEQRVSSLQQRLQARRDLYSGTSVVTTPAINPGTPALSTTTPGGITPRMGVPDTSPKNVNDALNLLKASRESTKTSKIGEPAMDSNKRAHGNENNNLAPPPTAPKPTIPARPAASRAVSELRDQLPTSAIQSKKLRQLDGYVGFANLPNQVYRKAVKKGFEFTLMVAGESGLGKSTLINSMFLTDIYSVEHPGPSARIKKTVNVDTNNVLLQENGVNLSLTIVDTPGFGDAVDNSDCWDPVIQYVESQYENFLDAETRVNRIVLPDTRVHACVYFIAPSGHGLKPLDVEFMQRLHDKVNIIPVIAKSDTMTPEEVARFKKQILNQIVQSRIKIYEFPESETDEDNEKHENRKMKDRVPFAIVGSNTIIENGDGKKVRGRKYPWGIVDIENLDQCDFIPLRNMLIRTNLQDLKQVTNDVHYENYRCRKLAGVAGGSVDKIPNRNPMAQIEEERREHCNKLLKMEKEMEEVFERKVREKKQKLSDSENDLEKRHKESKEKLEQQKRELENKMLAFEQEKAAWEQAHHVTIDELKRLSMESLDGGKKKKGGALSGVSFRMGR